MSRLWLTVALFGLIAGAICALPGVSSASEANQDAQPEIAAEGVSQEEADDTESVAADGSAPASDEANDGAGEDTSGARGESTVESEAGAVDETPATPVGGSRSEEGSAAAEKDVDAVENGDEVSPNEEAIEAGNNETHAVGADSPDAGATSEPASADIATTEPESSDQVVHTAAIATAQEVAKTDGVTDSAKTASTSKAKTTPVKAKRVAKKVSTAPRSGWYSIRTALNSAFYVQAKGSKAKPGTKIILAPSNSFTGQAFQLVKSGSHYRLVSGAGMKARLYIDAAGNVSLQKKNTRHSLFSLVSEGGSSYRIVNVATGLALAVASNASTGVQIVARSNSAGSKSQIFTLEARKGILKEGVYAIRTVVADKKAVSPAKNSRRAGVKASVKAFDGRMLQKWQVTAIAGKKNAYTIEDIATGYRLATKGRHAILAKPADAGSQKWTVVGVNEAVVLKNLANGKCLRLGTAGTAENARLALGAKTYEKPKRWVFNRVNAVRSGVYEFDSATNKKLALEVKGASSSNNASVTVGSDDNSAKQRWYYDATARTLTNLNSGKVLAIQGGNAANGIKLVQTSYNGAKSQKWSFVYLGGGRFTLVSDANSALRMNANGTTSSSGVSVANSSGAGSQRWVVREDNSARTSYMDMPFTLEQMARWQKAGNSYLARDTISYLVSVLNPANGSKYKFLDLRNSTGVSAAALDSFINTYGSTGKLKGLGSAFVTAAKTYKVNEVYLLAHAILESGWGKSELAMGYHYAGGTIDGKKYPKGTYYNFYGIGAYDSSPLSGGRKLAIINGWNTPAKAVTGAAKWITGNYVYGTNFSADSRYPQPTLYAMKWDTARTKAIKGYGWHQYATSRTWADSIGRLIDQCYAKAKANPALNYIIPRYK